MAAWAEQIYGFIMDGQKSLGLAGGLETLGGTGFPARLNQSAGERSGGVHSIRTQDQAVVRAGSAAAMV